MYTFGIRRSGRERGGGVQFLALGRTQGGKTDKVLKGGRGGLQFIKGGDWGRRRGKACGGRSGGSWQKEAGSQWGRG